MNDKKRRKRKKQLLNTAYKPEIHKAEAQKAKAETEYFQPSTIIHELPVEKTEAPKEAKKPKPPSRINRLKEKSHRQRQKKQNTSAFSAPSLSTAERALTASSEDKADDSTENSSIEAFYAARVIAEDAVYETVSSVQNYADKDKKTVFLLSSGEIETGNYTTSHEASSESREEHRAQQKRYQKKRNKRRQVEENFGRKKTQDTPETVGVVEYIREKLLSRPEEEKPGRKAKAVVAVILVIALIAVFVMALVSSASMLIEVLTSYLAISTYPSDDGDMLAAESQYCWLEEQLQQELMNYQSTHDYDDYEFELDDIGHDPYVLISCITAKVGGEWSIGEVQDILQDLFDRQYELKEEVETVEDETVCTVTLTNNDLAAIPGEILDEEQLSRYAIYMAVLGNRPDLFPASEYIGKYINGEYEVYEIPPEALEDEKFAAMIEEAEKYLGYPYVWGGSSPSTSFDCSGFICWILNQSGWSVGRTTAQGLFNSCTPVSRANARPGDLVFFTGTYKTDDRCSHVGLYVGENMMLHCGDPITYTSIASDYWQSHFYAFARLP